MEKENRTLYLDNRAGSRILQSNLLSAPEILRQRLRWGAQTTNTLHNAHLA